MEIQRGKEKMKERKYNRDIGATAGCTLRLLEGSFDDGLPHGIKADAWFGSVRTAMSVAAKGHEGVFQVKQNKGLFPKEYIEKALEDAPGGVKIVLSGAAPNNVPLIALGYRYSRNTTLCFVMTSRAGSTNAGNPYIMKYTDGFGNLCQREVERPEVISKFFSESNTIDSHNQVRQSNLALEKKWLTKDPFFRLTTTLIGICVADTWKLADFHKLINGSKRSDEKKMTITRFAGILGWQILHNAPTLASGERDIEAASTSPAATVTMNSLETISSVTIGNDLSIESIRSAVDANGKTHHLVLLPKAKDGMKKKTLTRPCKLCKENNKRHDVRYICMDCNSAFCSLDSHNKDRDCFLSHVRKIVRVLPRRGRH
jgi:hypothetical protein